MKDKYFNSCANNLSLLALDDGLLAKKKKRKIHYPSTWISTLISCLFMKNKGNSWPAILKRIIVLSNLVSSVGSLLFPPCFLLEVLSGFQFPSWLVQPCKWIPTTLHDTSVIKDYAGRSEELRRSCVWQGVSWAQVLCHQLGGGGLSTKDWSLFKGCRSVSPDHQKLWKSLSPCFGVTDDRSIGEIKRSVWGSG